jgi:hypothetical protein
MKNAFLELALQVNIWRIFLLAAALTPLRACRTIEFFAPG